MAKVYDDPATTENEDELFKGLSGGGDGANLKAILSAVAVVLCILMPAPILMAAVVAFALWGVFRWIHVRISVITGVSIIMSAFSVLMLARTSPWSALPGVLSHAVSPGAGSIPSRIVYIYSGTSGFLWGGVILGCIVGTLCSFMTRGKIHYNPFLVLTKGERFYHWRYRRTPLEMLRRRIMIKKMKDETFRTKGDSFPMGIEEEPINPPEDPAYIKYDTPISRYASEAFTHSLLTGASGSGKEVHKDTLLPTPCGMRTIEHVKVGDTLFDENGNRTRILAKYHPNDKHYEITFSDGTKIKAGGDHLWKVNEVGKRRHAGRRLDTMYSDEQLNILREALRSCSDSDTVTSTEAKRQLGDWIVYGSGTSYYSIIRNLTKINDGHQASYNKNELLDKIKRTSKITDSVKRELIEHIDNEPSDYISREYLVSKIHDGKLVTEMTRSINDRTKAEASYNKKEYLSALITEEERRRKRMDDIHHLSRREKSSLDTSMLESIVIDTKTMYRNMLANHGKKSNVLYSVSLAKCVDYDKQDLPVQPYAFGAWLGDGSSYDGAICGIDNEVRDNVLDEGYALKSTYVKKANGKTRFNDFNNWRFTGLKHQLFNDSGLKTYADNPNRLVKDIPDAYIISSREQRIQLLKGLLDTDGTVDSKGRIEINMTDEPVVRKMRMIVCSLGWLATKIARKPNHYRNADGEQMQGKDSYRFSFHPDCNVFTVKRKHDRLQTYLDKVASGEIKQQARYHQRFITSIKPLDDDNEDYYCLTVDSPSHLFLCSESFIPTHNTITMQNSIRHNMENRQTVFIIDCKADPNFAAKMASWSNELGLDFYHFAPTMGNEYRITQNPAGPAFYDPLAHGRATDHTDMLLSTREWDAASAVYKSNAQSMLSTVFAIMEEMDTKSPALSNIDFSRGTMYTFYELIRNESNLASAIGTIPSQSQTRLLADELETLIHATNRTREAQGVQNAMGEYKGFMRGLMTSDGRYMVYPKSGNRKMIDVFKLASEPGNVVLFSISATKATDIGAMVGSMICTDLTNMTAMRAISGQTNPVSIYVDEFQSLPPTAVKSMLEKARSAKIGITLAFQSLEQVTASTGTDAFINALLDTCGNFIFHAGSNETTAQTMSQIIGKHWTNQYAIQRRNQQGMLESNWINKRNANVITNQVEKYIIEPSAFQHLSAPRKENGFKSEAIVIKKSSSDPVDRGTTGPVAHKVWMIPPDFIIKDDYFDPNAPIMDFKDEPPETGVNEHDDGTSVFPAITAGIGGTASSIDASLFNDGSQSGMDSGSTGIMSQWNDGNSPSGIGQTGMVGSQPAVTRTGMVGSIQSLPGNGMPVPRRHPKKTNDATVGRPRRQQPSVDDSLFNDPAPSRRTPRPKNANSGRPKAPQPKNEGSHANDANGDAGMSGRSQSHAAGDSRQERHASLRKAGAGTRLPSSSVRLRPSRLQSGGHAGGNAGNASISEDDLFNDPVPSRQYEGEAPRRQSKPVAPRRNKPVAPRRRDNG